MYGFYPQHQSSNHETKRSLRQDDSFSLCNKENTHPAPNSLCFVKVLVTVVFLCPLRERCNPPPLSCTAEENMSVIKAEPWQHRMKGKGTGKTRSNLLDSQTQISQSEINLFSGTQVLLFPIQPV